MSLHFQLTLTSLFFHTTNADICVFIPCNAVLMWKFVLMGWQRKRQKWRKTAHILSGIKISPFISDVSSMPMCDGTATVPWSSWSYIKLGWLASWRHIKNEGFILSFTGWFATSLLAGLRYRLIEFNMAVTTLKEARNGITWVRWDGLVRKSFYVRSLLFRWQSVANVHLQKYMWQDKSNEVQIILLIFHFRRELPVTGQCPHRPTIRVRCWGNLRICVSVMFGLFYIRIRDLVHSASSNAPKLKPFVENRATTFGGEAEQLASVERWAGSVVRHLKQKSWH